MYTVEILRTKAPKGWEELDVEPMTAEQAEDFIRNSRMQSPEEFYSIRKRKVT